MALAADRRLGGGQGGPRVAGEADEQLELLVRRPYPGYRVADRDDREQCLAGPVERNEDLVVGPPGLGVLADVAPANEARAAVVRPVELALPDEVRTAAEEALVEQGLPALPLVGAAEERLADVVVAVDGGDA